MLWGRSPSASTVDRFTVDQDAPFKGRRSLRHFAFTQKGERGCPKGEQDGERAEGAGDSMFEGRSLPRPFGQPLSALFAERG